jgi:hypothetical protein
MNGPAPRSSKKSAARSAVTDGASGRGPALTGVAEQVEHPLRHVGLRP